MDSKQDYLLPI